MDADPQMQRILRDRDIQYDSIASVAGDDKPKHERGPYLAPCAPPCERSLKRRGRGGRENQLSENTSNEGCGLHLPRDDRGYVFDNSSAGKKKQRQPALIIAASAAAGTICQAPHIKPIGVCGHVDERQAHGTKPNNTAMHRLLLLE